jgi:hypothetical protein
MCEPAREWSGFQGIPLPLASFMPFVKATIAKLPVKVEIDTDNPLKGDFGLTCPCGQHFSGNWARGIGTQMFCQCGKLYYIECSGRLFDLTHLRQGDKIVWPMMKSSRGNDGKADCAGL